MKPLKGESGYQKRHKLMYGLFSLIGFVIVIAIFTISFLYFGTAKNYFNILSVLVILPTAKFFVQYLMIPWKNKVDPEYFARMKEEIAPLPLYCELAMTGAEKHFEIKYLFISPDKHILAYSDNPKNDPEQFRKAVTNFLNFYQWDTEVKLYSSLDRFDEDVKNLAMQYRNAGTKELDTVKEVFAKISIMSV